MFKMRQDVNFYPKMREPGAVWKRLPYWSVRTPSQLSIVVSNDKEPPKIDLIPGDKIDRLPIQVQLAGRQINALVDTGSSRSYLAGDVYRLTGIKEKTARSTQARLAKVPTAPGV